MANISAKPGRPTGVPAVFSDNTQVIATENEVVFTFFQPDYPTIDPNVDQEVQAICVGRVVVSKPHARQILAALNSILEPGT